MEEHTLVLVGLPDDFVSVKPKLELHFGNKRKSGGQVSEIRNHPIDKRKALLVYQEVEVAKRVLEKGPHKVVFKEFGVVELQVKPLEEDDIENVKRTKPVALPRLRLENEIASGKSARETGEAAPGPFHQEGLQQDCGGKVPSLCVSSDCPIKEDILRLYFEQFTDDIDICCHGDNQWILNLTSQSDLETILTEKNHVLEGSLLSVQLYDERQAEEKFDPHRFILSGFSDHCKCSHLSIFINSCSKGAKHSWEVLKDGQRIAVTFKQDIDVPAFLKKCSSKKIQNVDISCSRLEYTDSVLVEGSMESISEEALMAYFSSTRSNGGQIKYLNWVNNAKSALIAFGDFHAAHRVAKEKHSICGVGLRALLFYDSLKQALTGEMLTTPPSSHRFSIPVDASFLKYIQNDDECKEDFESTLKEHYASITYDLELPQIVVEMAVDRELLLLHHWAHTWERKTKQAVEMLLEKYSIVILMATEEVWERVKDKCLTLDLKTTRVYFERAHSTVVVLGHQNDVKNLQGEVQVLLNKAREELEVEKNRVERKIHVGNKEELDFVWKLVSGKLGDIEHAKDDKNLIFHLKGLRDKVNAAEEILKNTKDNLSIQTLHLSPNLTKFLQSLDLTKFERNHFSHISATVFSCGDSIQILSERQDNEKARHKINEVLMEDVINLTADQRKVTQGEHWGIFYLGLLQEVESSNNSLNVKMSYSVEQIAVWGFQNVVIDVARKLRGYLDNKMPVTEDIPLKSLRQVEYVDACMKLSEAPEIKALDLTILSSRTQATPCLKVTAASDKIKAAVAAVEKQISHIVHEKHVYSDAGESKVLEKHQDALKANAREFACKLYFTIEQVSHTSSHLASRFKMGDSLTLPIAQGELSRQTAEAKTTLSNSPANKSKKPTPPTLLPKLGEDLKVVIRGVKVILRKGDITTEAVDAIVNSTNKSLNLDTGVSGAILKAAGKSVVDECVKLGTQKEDGVAVTGGGNLKCKHIIQMVGPTTTAGITSSTERVLQLCESKSAKTVSIPAIGTGKGNIKPEESIKAVLKGLQNHLSQAISTSIKSIFIVAFEEKVFDSFRNCFAEWNQQSQQRTKAGSGFKLPSIHSSSKQLPANQVEINGIRLEVKKGDITTETVRGIVNTTNNALNLKTGVSGAIFSAAGSSVEKECGKFGPQQDDGVVVTSGGALHCDFIIHMVGPRTLSAATSQVEKALEQCEKNNITTVSFPAIGTGAGQLNAADAIGAMLQGFQNHLSRQISTVLKLIYIVVYEDKILQEFLLGLKQWLPRPGLDNSCDEDEYEYEYEDVEDDEDWGATSEMDSADEDNNVEEDDNEGNIEIMMGPIKVKAFCGDITKETTDVIVSSTNATLDLSRGVSGAILKAAGQTVLDECRAQGRQPNDGVVVTKPGHLKCKHIVHMVGQTTEKYITNSMYKVLVTCNSINAQCVSFPALGTGAGNLPASQVATAMIDAINNFVSDKPKSCITVVHIVIFQPKMMSDFEQVIKKIKSVTSKRVVAAKAGLRRSNIPTLHLESATASITFPAMVAEVYGASAENLAKVKKCLDDLISQECTSQDMKVENLHLLTENEKKDIVEASRKHQVRITMLQSKLTVSGMREDVLSVILQIKDTLQEVREWEDQEREANRIWETVRWEVGKSDAWTGLNQKINYNLELAFHRKDQSYEYQHHKDHFKVDFEKMQQTDNRGQTTRIKRRPLTDSETAIITIPPTWTKMDGKDLDIIELPEKSHEFRKISEEFLQSCQEFAQKNSKNIEVVQIQRIQHQEQWRKYTVSKQALDKKYPNNSNEQFLYHGTLKDICEKINNNGFNRSFCGRNGALYGNGTYFAKEAYYSCDDHYSRTDGNGHKYIYRARVLTGKPCIGQPGMKEPSPVDPRNLQAGRHDCAVDNLKNPFIFVIFCDTGAYPEYLITFKAV